MWKLGACLEFLPLKPFSCKWQHSRGVSHSHPQPLGNQVMFMIPRRTLLSRNVTKLSKQVIPQVSLPKIRTLIQDLGVPRRHLKLCGRPCTRCMHEDLEKHSSNLLLNLLTHGNLVVAPRNSTSHSSVAPFIAMQLSRSTENLPGLSRHSFVP